MPGFTAADAERFVAALVLPFLRILALYSSAPLFSHRSVPRPARIGLAALTAALLAPTLPPAPEMLSPRTANQSCDLNVESALVKGSARVRNSRNVT